MIEKAKAPKEFAEATAQVYDQKYATQCPTHWTCCDVSESDHIVHLVEKYHRRISGPRCQGATCLDIGCGFGFLTAAFARAGYAATGIDYSRVAVEAAWQRFRGQCEFLHMNAFEPSFQLTFDLMFCRGFSGYNTHNPSAVSDFINIYMPLLKPGGVFVLAHSTNFTGKEYNNEMPNWTRETLRRIVAGVPADRVVGPKFLMSRRKNRLRWFLAPIQVVMQRRQCFLVLFRRQSTQP